MICEPCLSGDHEHHQETTATKDEIEEMKRQRLIGGVGFCICECSWEGEVNQAWVDQVRSYYTKS